MECKVCQQLEEAYARARKPDPPGMLEGLTEAGLRNRALQVEERKTKTELELEKHRRGCPVHAERPAF